MSLCVCVSVRVCVCVCQFADMPVVSESGCSGGGRECIPAGRDESMQREREGGRGGREGAHQCDITPVTPVQLLLHFHSFDRGDKHSNTLKCFFFFFFV